VTLTGHGANGDTIANLTYNFLVDAIGTVQQQLRTERADRSTPHRNLAGEAKGHHQPVHPPPGDP
jgi:hypothetical protein